MDRSRLIRCLSALLLGLAAYATARLTMPAAPRASTSSLIADALRAAIVDGTLAPGAPLRQDAIARHFSVSAIPVREALRQLESEGWARVEMNKGATVAPLSADEAREIYEIRSALESLAGVPVTSSNHAMAWHSLRLAGVGDPLSTSGRLFELQA